MPDISDDTNWFEADASNNKASPNGWPEGMMPSGVNDSARANMGALKRFWDRINPVLVATSSTLLPSGTLWQIDTSNTAYPAAYTEGEMLAFKAPGAATGGDQIQVNTLGQKPVYRMTASGAVATVAGDWAAGSRPQLVYDATLNSGAGGFLLLNPDVPLLNTGSGGISTPGGITIGGGAIIHNSLTVDPQLTISGTGGQPLQIVTPVNQDCGILLQNGNHSWVLQNQGASSPGEFWIFDSTAGAIRLRIDTGGTTYVSTLNASGNITCNLITSSDAHLSVATVGGVAFSGSGNINTTGAISATTVQGANIIATGNFVGPASGYTFYGGTFGVATVIQFNATKTVALGDFQVNGTGIFQNTITVGGLTLSNTGGYLYSPSSMRTPGLIVDGNVGINGSVNIGGQATFGGSTLTSNDVAAQGVFRRTLGGAKGARVECWGGDWDAMSFAMSGAQLLVSPDIGASGYFFANAGVFSDARLKDNIRDTKVDALAAIMATPVRAFEWNEEGKRLMPHAAPEVPIGLVAQELEETMAAVVGVNELAGGMRHIVDHNLTPYLVRALQQLAGRIAQLEAK